MIIEKPINENSPITIKTTGGDEIVARFVSEDESTITVLKPLALMSTQQGMGLAPFAFTVPLDAKLTLYKSAIVFIAKTEEQMASQYMNSTSTVVTAPPGQSFKI
jgi:hypothetical protein